MNVGLKGGMIAFTGHAALVPSIDEQARGLLGEGILRASYASSQAPRSLATCHPTLYAEV